jgi:hypothetical protein
MDQNPNRSLPYGTSRLAPRIDLVDMASEIERADSSLGIAVGARLETIRDQIRLLQKEAQEILEQAKLSAKLHRALCNFRKVPGKTYHLYGTEGTTYYFSMLSPDDWNGSPPHPFEGSYRLEADLSFTPAGKEKERVDGKALV